MKRSVGSLLLLTSVAGALSLNDLDMNKVASGSVKLTKAAVGLSDEKEIKIGHEVGAYLAARFGLVNDPAKTRYLNLVGQTVARQSTRKIPFHFGILKTNQINAWAAPGGYIFVTEGLLAFLQNEAELAGALGHEISHVQQRHIAHAMRKADLLGAGQDFAAASVTGADQYAELTNFSIDFLNRGFSRGEELEADGLGTALAAQAGYNPADYRAAITRLGVLKDVSRLGTFNKTHPPAAQRLQTIDRAVKKNKLLGGQSLPDRFHAAIKAQ